MRGLMILKAMLMSGWALAATPIQAQAQAPIPPPPNWSPNLDCGARIYAVDSVICEDAVLLQGARRVEEAYRRAVARQALPQDTLLADQQAWSKRRNMCVFQAKARVCVERLQGRRLNALETSIPEAKR